MDAATWLGVIPAWAGMLTGGLALALQWWQHHDKGPKLEVYILSYMNTPSADRLSVSIEVINKGDAPATLDNFAVVDSRCERYGLMVARPWGEDFAIEVPQHSRRQFALSLFGTPARDADARPGAAPILSFRTSFSRDPVEVPVPEQWIKLSDDTEAAAAARRQRKGAV